MEVKLAGRGGSLGRGCGEGEEGAGEGTEDTGEDAGGAHGHGDEGFLVAVGAEKGEQAKAVVERGSGGNDFKKRGSECGDAGMDEVEVGGGMKAVPADEEGGRAVAEDVECFGSDGAEVFGGFEGEVDDRGACDAGGMKDAGFVAGRAGEVATILSAAAGEDGVEAGVEVEEGFERGEKGGGVGEGVDAEFEEGGAVQQGQGGLKHGGAAEGDTKLGQGGEGHGTMV